MKLFSQRKGVKPVKSVIQVDHMDSDLRNGLWNALTRFYWDQVGTLQDSFSISHYDGLYILLERLWDIHFKRPIDTVKDYWPETYQELREYFFNCEWFEVYDFIECIANSYPDERNLLNLGFMGFCNSVLERELSAYRFVGGKITQITSEEEIAEMEEALAVPDPLRPVSNHLKRALDLLADRESPDYRNSIKESILAVEACCQLITGNPKAILGNALKEIGKKTKVDLHGALKNAFSSLYGYASDAEGIRHALLDEPNLEFEDAKFMLVSCSAFINYLVAKVSKAGIKF